MQELKYFVENVEYNKSEFDCFYRKILNNSKKQRATSFYQNAKIINSRSEFNIALVLKVDGVCFYILGKEEQLKNLIRNY